MIEVPKIVYDRLRAGSSAQAETAKAHLDADRLAALTEQALSGPERDGVLAHLALCENCREVVALALPATDPASASNGGKDKDKDADLARVSLSGALSPRKAGLLGPTVRWAALAAAVVVVASVLLIRPGKLNGPTPVAVNPQVATLSSASTSPSAPTAPQASSLFAAEHQLNDDRSNKDRSRSTTAMLKKRTTPRDHATTETLLASNRKDFNRSDLSSMSLASTARSNLDARAAHTTNETVEVSGAHVAAKTQPSSANSLLALNDAPPIEKAKPALQEPSLQDQDAYTVNQADKEAGEALPLAKAQNSKALYAAKLSSVNAAAYERNSAWVIKTGVLQRSSNNGQSWEEALRAEHPLSCYLNQGTEVWAGGQAGTLFHSADAGLTWARIRPSVDSGALTSDITSIAATDVSAIEVSTSTNERWITMDRGRTWSKK